VTINLTDVTFDLLVAEQLHDIVPCEECKRTAHWTWVHTCGEVWLACSAHRAQLDVWCGSRPSEELYCLVCDQNIPTPTPWVAL